MIHLTLYPAGDSGTTVAMTNGDHYLVAQTIDQVVQMRVGTPR